VDRRSWRKYNKKLVKYFFYNAMIYYDATSIIFRKKRINHIYLVRLIVERRMNYATRHVIHLL